MTPSHLKQYFTNNNQYHLRDLVPILTPAIDKNNCSVDQRLIDLRIQAICLSMINYLGVFSVAHAFFGINSYSLAGCYLGVVFSVSVSAIGFLDVKLAISSADMKAINEYFFFKDPSSSASFCVLNNYELLERFINADGNVNRSNADGWRLLDYAFENKIYMKSFDLLLAHGADVKLIDNYGESVFRKSVMHSDSTYLQSILNANKVNASDFNQAEQKDFLENAGCVQIKELLINFGFTAECIDSKAVNPPLLIPGSLPQA